MCLQEAVFRIASLALRIFVSPFNRPLFASEIASIFEKKATDLGDPAGQENHWNLRTPPREKCGPKGLDGNQSSVPVGSEGSWAALVPGS